MERARGCSDREQRIGVTGEGRDDAEAEGRQGGLAAETGGSVTRSACGRSI